MESNDNTNNPFTCDSCNREFPNSEHWCVGDICDFCNGDYDYINWLEDSKKEKRTYRKYKQIKIDKKVFLEFISGRGLKGEYKEWLKQSKTKKKIIGNS